MERRPDQTDGPGGRSRGPGRINWALLGTPLLAGGPVIMLLVLIRVLEGPAWDTLGLVWFFAPVVVLLVAARARAESAPEPSVRAERRRAWKMLCLMWVGAFFVMGLWLAERWDAPLWVALILPAGLIASSGWLLVIAWPWRGRRRTPNRSSSPPGQVR